MLVSKLLWDGKIKIGEVKYGINGNFTYFDQMWALNESESKNETLNPYQRNQQQKPYYDRLYHSLGYYTGAEDVYNSAGVLQSYNSGNLTAGDLKYEDTNGDGRITGEDLRRLGKSSTPQGQFGINLSAEWRGLSVSTLLHGSTAFDLYLSSDAAMKTGASADMPVAFGYQRDTWTPDNPNAQYPRLMSNTGLNNNNNYISSDFWLINGAYLRMKDIQVNYDLKYSLLKSMNWLSHCRIGLSGQNIFTIQRQQNMVWTQRTLLPLDMVSC